MNVKVSTGGSSSSVQLTRCSLLCKGKLHVVTGTRGSVLTKATLATRSLIQ